MDQPSLSSADSTGHHRTQDQGHRGRPTCAEHRRVGAAARATRTTAARSPSPRDCPSEQCSEPVGGASRPTCPMRTRRRSTRPRPCKTLQDWATARPTRTRSTSATKDGVRVQHDGPARRHDQPHRPRRLRRVGSGTGEVVREHRRDVITSPCRRCRGARRMLLRVPWPGSMSVTSLLTLNTWWRPTTRATPFEMTQPTPHADTSRIPSPRAALQSRAGWDGRDDGLGRRQSRPSDGHGAVHAPLAGV